MFRSDPKSPNIVIVLFFTIAALTTLPILFGTVRSSQCLCSHSLANVSAVALPGCQFLTPTKSSFRCTYLARTFLRQHSSYRRHILHVLHIVEPLPDVASAHSCGHSGFRQWQQSVNRGTREETCWVEMIQYGAKVMIDHVQLNKRIRKSLPEHSSFAGEFNHYLDHVHLSQRANGTSKTWRFYLSVLYDLRAC